MTGTRKRHSAAFKARVALEAAKQTRTLAELARAFQIHPVQISQWKKQLLDGAESLFGDGRRRMACFLEGFSGGQHDQTARLLHASQHQAAGHGQPPGPSGFPARRSIVS